MIAMLAQTATDTDAMAHAAKTSTDVLAQYGALVSKINKT